MTSLVTFPVSSHFGPTPSRPRTSRFELLGKYFQPGTSESERAVPESMRYGNFNVFVDTK